MPKPEPSPPTPIYEFGPFQLDIARYQLRREGLRLRMPPAPMALLTLFIERHGDLITRDDIVRRLWSAPEMVDVDQGINTAIRRIRQVLLDDPGSPRYIETVVGKGYRFIAEVREIRSAPAPRPSPSSESKPEPEDEDGLPPAPVVAPAPPEQKKAKLHARAWMSAVVALIVLISAYFGWRFLRRPVRYTATLSQVTTNDSEKRVTTAAISPDGKWIAYSDINGLYLRLLQSGKTVALNAPGNFRAERLAWFPDQTKLLVSGFDAKFATLDIWTVFITGVPPQLFRKEAHSGIPSPDGSKVAFLPVKDKEIWVSGIDGDGARRLVYDAQGRTYSALFWSENGKRISYLRNVSGPGYDDYESADADTGKVLAVEKNLSFSAAVAMTDGGLFMLRDSPANLRDDFSLWRVETDSATGALLSEPEQIATLPKSHAFGLTGSDYGHRLSFIASRGSPHVYVAQLEYPGPTFGEVKRLTYDTRTDYPHSWLSDNETVIFESDRVGAYHLYGQRLQDHDAREFNTGADHAVLPRVTPDGKWILYAMNPDSIMSPKSRLFRISVAGGGTPEQVDVGGPLQEFDCPLRSGSCVLLELEGKKYLHYYALDATTGRGRRLGRTSWVPHILGDWSVAPDGSAVVLAVHDPGNPRIRIVPLNPSGTSGQERELPVRGFGMLSGISWAADGKGWFVAADTGAGTLILYVNQHGATHVLRNTPLGTWGVPSPDGKKLAFVDQAVDSNVWVWDIQAHK
ncbi:MAG: winged helix-turn-helix domain-containing protein [Acidobacteria bacterium]|nr:winged helix-turn-helix domain-containing protein [Acidobacteriota bacterium]